MPAQGTKRRTGTSRSAEVIETAVRIFSEKGYENASMQEIGEALGMLKGSIYYYTPSKEQLLFDVIRHVHGEMMANLEKARARRGDDVMTRIRAYLEDFIGLTIDRLEYAGVFQREFRHLSQEHQSEISRERRRYEGLFQALLEEGQADGSVRTDVEAKLLTVASLTMVTAIPTWYRRTGVVGKDQLIADYIAMLVGAIEPPAS